jgi:Asp-tRNA(Asn)/Glu-tRNA(Gln) amidotransferase A subunit family amidase
MTDTLELASETIGLWTDLTRRDPDTTIQRLQTRFEEIEPKVRAFVPEPDRFSRLSTETKRIRRTEPEAGVLVGVPLGIKDIFHVEGLDTRAGSTLPVEILRGTEAESVTTLRQAGALVVGKTVSTEFAFFAPGPTRNPLDLGRTPGGSSSGSAAAVAAGLSAIALGSQTIGSISRPASFCGVVGFKPSYDRISTAGVIPLSPSLDHVGTFTHSTSDARILAGLLCKRWSPSEVTRKPRLGLPEGPYLERASDEAQKHFAETCGKLRDHGYDLVPAEAFADLDQIVDIHYTIVAAEAARFHQRWFSRYGDRYHPKTRELIDRGSAVPDAELEDRLARLPHLRRVLTQTMKQHQIDLWLSPAAPGAAPCGLDSTGDPIMSLPWTQAGLPTLAVPAGPGDSGLPIGLQITAGWWKDEELLEWGIGIEDLVR